ncbi:putative zinc-binding metallopeptidase [Hydrogenophaga sp.]|uniref:zinc-binding metallopeptidase family protein n=1 Tax=Hydrogenophaga sp. TaxID=1904254 RepID=UPI00272047BB|nr:putative zinc-binding metallopeptidase [Hydrogenophaga sp.]MDO8906500.1 putative zinc-binding metallopeptidase [Hydrogenophaga sp.]
MKTFQCSHCQSLVFFNDLICLNCQHSLGFDPCSLTLLAMTPVSQGSAEDNTQTIGSSGLWQVAGDASTEQASPAGAFRFCRNHTDHRACNFLVAEDDPEGYCVSCRQTRVIPNLDMPGNLQRWATIEHAKRRLFYTLAKLGLEEAVSGGGGLRTPAYEFLEDIPGEIPVMTGHDDGLITINIAEADDAERTRRRVDLHEPYRTLLGHLRHEVGHYFWDQFFLNDPQAIHDFREIFGDETLDYGQALQQHYQQPRGDWQSAYVSSYATSHPWEDWAETWAHYLHLIDLLETAANYQMAFTLKSPYGPISVRCLDPYAAMAGLATPQDADAPPSAGLIELLNQGMGVSLVLNSLNRSLGQEDAYPFALTTPVLHKLGFIHEIVQRKRSESCAI